MKNVNNDQLKTCIFLLNDEFEKIVKSIFPYEIEFYYSLDGLTLLKEDDCMEDDELFGALEEYFDVSKITSIHIDDCDTVGIWIVYKE